MVVLRIFFILISFVFLSLFGVGLGMEMQGEQISFCPFMAEHAVVCPMSVIEHIAQWQQAFLGTPKGSSLALLVLFLAIVFVPFVKTFSRIENAVKLRREFDCQRARAFAIIDPLLLAFSDGILKPKIYAPAYI